MNYLFLLAALLSSPALSFELTPGEQIERYNVPNVCPCGHFGDSWTHGLWYTIKFNEPSCLRFEDVSARREDGTPIAIGIEESGTPGESGYQIDLTVDDSGTILLHVKIVDICPKVS